MKLYNNYNDYSNNQYQLESVIMESTATTTATATSITTASAPTESIGSTGPPTCGFADGHYWTSIGGVLTWH